MILRQSTVQGNTAGWDGGGARNLGTLRLHRTSVAANSAEFGGGIANYLKGGAATLDLVLSSVTGNDASQEGGGIFAGPADDVTLDPSSSVTGNDPDDCVGTPAC